MSSAVYEKILEEADLLSPTELNQLIKDLIKRKTGGEPGAESSPKWEDFIGSAPYPLCGEDAQEWVSRTRRESDERRAIR